MGAPARELEREVMLEASRLGVVLGKNSKGMFRQLFSDAKQKAGWLLPGSSDLVGWDKATGRIVCVEIKAGKDTVKPEQETFMRLVREAGGIAGVIRSVDDLRILLTPESKR